jgi:hypothetical protein
MPTLEEIEKIVEANKATILQGGARSGKTKICQALMGRANNAHYINAILPLSDWAPAGKGKATDRLALLQPDLLIIDNAECLKGRKYEEGAALMERASALVCTCRSYHQLPARIQARLEHSPIVALSKDSATTDISYILIAAIIICLIVIGDRSALISLAAIRYAFIGSRGFGR